jgi:hypothetical protein
VILKDGSGDPVDFAFPITSSSTLGIANIGSSYLDGTTGAPWYGSVAANDPRANTASDDWEKYENKNNDNEITIDLAASTGESNDNAIDTSTGDAEDGVQSNSCSTAYIANRPDITFWELGAVHRAEPWRTINLRKYTDPSASGSTGRKYGAGDAILFDQLKLGSFTEVRGRVNLNSPHITVWERVLNGLRLGQDYADVHSPSITSGGTAITSAVVTTLAGDIVSEIGGSALARGEIANVDKLTQAQATPITDYNLKTDRAWEEAVCKIANLLTARQNIFTVLITAQSVKDVGPNGNTTSDDFVEYPSGGSKFFRIEGEQRVLATVYRDAATNRFRVVRMEYLED